MIHGKKRTRIDVNRELLNMIAPTLGERFEKELLPHMRLSDWAYQEITEEEYQFWLRQFRRELPAFRQFLLNYPC